MSKAKSVARNQVCWRGSLAALCTTGPEEDRWGRVRRHYFLLVCGTEGTFSMIPSPSGVTGRGQGQSAPLETSDREIFADVSGIRKKEARKKGKRGENWEEKKENCEKEGGKLELEVGKVIKRGEDHFFFFFPCFSLLKTTEICFGSTKIGIFYREKSISRQKKNREKLLCPPQ